MRAGVRLCRNAADRAALPAGVPSSHQDRVSEPEGFVGNALAGRLVAKMYQQIEGVHRNLASAVSHSFCPSDCFARSWRPRSSRIQVWFL